MSSKECEEQLKGLINCWNEDYTTKVNATDIEAIKHLMLENQIQQDKITELRIQISSKEEVANDLQQRINKAIHRIQLLQMDNEVTVRDLGLIARDLKGDNNE